MMDAEHACVRPLLPVPAWLNGKGGPPEGYCHRVMIGAVRYLVDRGVKWRADVSRLSRLGSGLCLLPLWISDASSTSPHLRRAPITDEGGRGLFLVAQLTERWGTRYTARGKTIRAEQPLPLQQPPCCDAQ